ETAQSAASDGETAINGVSEAAKLQAAKNDADAALVDAAQNAILTINGDTSLTGQQKVDLIDQVNNELEEGKANINNATTPETAQSAASDGETAINGVSDAAKLQAAKNDAVKQLDQARNNTIEQIKNSGLSAGRQQALINEVNAAHDEAVQKVNADTTIPAVNQDVADGLAAISQVQITMTGESDQLHAAQDAVNNVLAEATQNAIDAINDNDSLTAAEKTDLINKVNAAADQAKANIHNATTPEAAQSAESAGETAINGVSEAAKLQAAKNDAVKQLNQACDNVVEQIKHSGLSAERQQVLINEVKTTYDTAINKINADTTIPAVNQDAADSLAAINQIKLTVTHEVAKLDIAKDAAINKLNEAAQNAITVIKNNSSLKENQKTQLIAQINEIVSRTKHNINSATTSEEINNAEMNGEQDISAIISSAKLQAAKNDAISKLETAKQQAILHIQDSKLSDSQKNKLIAQINTVYDGAISKITLENNVSDVAQETLNGLNRIKAVVVEFEGEIKQLSINNDVASDDFDYAIDDELQNANNNEIKQAKTAILPNTNVGNSTTNLELLTESLELLALVSLTIIEGGKNKNHIMKK
ncbi:protein of unknown function, partial [Weissella bombi]